MLYLVSLKKNKSAVFILKRFQKRMEMHFYIWEDTQKNEKRKQCYESEMLSLKRFSKINETAMLYLGS